MNEIRRFEVGGCVRDELRGGTSNDVDFAIEAPSFEAMVEFVESEGHRIVENKPKFFTLKAVVAKGHPLRERTQAVDFVLCRKDGESSDGRHPDFVEPGTIFDDLARRDFTMNAIAKDEAGNLIDPHGGAEDIERRTIRFVGDPMERIREDGLRVLRAFRFAHMFGFGIAGESHTALMSDEAADMMLVPSIERVETEVVKMFAHEPRLALEFIESLPEKHQNAIWRDGFWLSITPTRKKRG